MTAKGAKPIKDKSLFGFRVETTNDVWAFLVSLFEMGQFWVKDLNISHHGDDCRVELRLSKINLTRQPDHVPATLSEPRRPARDIVDCHVVFESLDDAEQFTEDRHLPEMTAPENGKIDKTPHLLVKTFEFAKRQNKHG